ncbi:hypothetical protein C8J57DRAFT_1517129 [Mycena rebaudengoi]|nr:hypothetical protein C8J57DRAFT_1517129 [Mycena rebaudengoi]
MADSSQHTPRSGISAPSDIRSRVSELNDHIRTLDQSLAAAHCERNDLQSRLDDYKYPILTLPVEVTSEIFINFLPIYPLAPPIVRILSPALLGQICSKWRTVAFNTPWLRRAIEIEVDTQGAFSVARSKMNPLQLLLDALTTPALRHLAVSQRGELSTHDWSTIFSLITRSGCTPESVVITHSSPALHEADVRALFPSINFIEVFGSIKEANPGDDEEVEEEEDDVDQPDGSYDDDY